MIKTTKLAMHFSDSSILYEDLKFESGRSYVLLGASGCGKSTLLNLLAGILTPSEGSIEIDGRDMVSCSRKEKDAFRIRNIGYVFQDFKLLDGMSVVDNIGILRLEGVDISRMDAILEKLGIGQLRRRRAGTLSGGEKQRVAIARALVKEPDIILADEPTGNLNYAVGRVVVEELLAAAKGKTLICVTHDERLCELFDEVIDMDRIAKAIPRERTEIPTGLKGGAKHA